MDANLFYRKRGKRLVDFVFATLALLVLSPLLCVVALVLRWKLGSPVLFRHRRPGYKGNPFILYKFRTMTNAVDAKGNALPDEQRQTRFGQLLRKTSIDELPELFNVLRGEMSLVGPRPLIMRYLPRYTPKQRRRHDTMPGITGWAQVNGRNLISWETKFEMDVWYVDHQSLWLDLGILVRTLWKVFAREGISAPFCFSSLEFMGTPNADRKVPPDYPGQEYSHKSQ